MQDIQNILFDLDGTLVDSSGAIRASLTHALDRLGTGWPPGMAVESVIGLPLVDILRERFGITGKRAETGIRHYREHYDAHARAESRIYDRVDDLLRQLSGAGLNLFVATVKPGPVAEKVLREMGGSSMDHTRREKSAIIAHALQTFGLAAEHSLMVGDRAQDITGARENGLRAVGVTWGFGSPEELTAAGPDHIVSRPGELAPLLSGGAAF
jgi:phosphoglycolate phosphatase